MNFAIPKELSHLRIDERGYPTPFFVPIVKGVPNFRYMDQTKLNLIIDHHLCHICGKKLNKDFCYFISGPLGLKNQVSSDGAMHRVCAEFSLKVCPHMHFFKAERKTTDPLGTHSPHAPGKPEFIMLIKATVNYKAKFYKEFGYRLIHYKAVSAERYVYENNILVKEADTDACYKPV